MVSSPVRDEEDANTNLEDTWKRNTIATNVEDKDENRVEVNFHNPKRRGCLGETLRC